MGADISEKATEATPSSRSSSHGGDSTDVPTPGAKEKGAGQTLAALEKADTHVTTAQKPEDNDPYKNLCACSPSPSFVLGQYTYPQNGLADPRYWL